MQCSRRTAWHCCTKGISGMEVGVRRLDWVCEICARMQVCAQCWREERSRCQAGREQAHLPARGWRKARGANPVLLHPRMHEMPFGALYLHCSNLDSKKCEAISTAAISVRLRAIASSRIDSEALEFRWRLRLKPQSRLQRRQCGHPAHALHRKTALRSLRLPQVHRQQSSSGSCLLHP